MSDTPQASPLGERIDSTKPYAHSLFRIVIGLLFFCHGASKHLGWFGGSDGNGGTLPAWEWPGSYAGWIELVTGALVLLGLGTRGAAFLGSGAMAYAYFTEHQPDALWPIENHGEAAVLFCWALLLIVFNGPGPWSLDRLVSGARESAPVAAGTGPRRAPVGSPVD
ncbi:DoxX family protein [Streptomyces sp. M19]